MKLKKAVILKAFTRWGRAYAIGEVVEDRIDKIGVLVHERKARLVKPEESAPVAQPPQPAPKAPKPEPPPAVASPEPPAPVIDTPSEPEPQAAEPVTVADALPLDESHEEAEPVDTVTGTRRTRKGKTKPE